MKINQIMSKPAITCRSCDMLSSAAQLMWEHDCGAIPVVNDDGRVVGMITDRDICMSVYLQGFTPYAIPVSSAMSEQVFSSHADDTLDAAERLMSEKQIRRIPVVDKDNRPIGVVSLNDIALYAASARKKDGLDHEVTQTLAAICQHRAQPQTAKKPRRKTRAKQAQAVAI